MSLISRNTLKPVPSDDGPSEGAGSGRVAALLGPGSAFEGKLVFEGTVQIEGQFTGEIRSKDTLVVGKTGKVQGEILVGTAIIHGEVTGNIRCRELLQMHAPARVKGAVFTPQLVIDRGVVFEGTTQMEKLDADPARK